MFLFRVSIPIAPALPRFLYRRCIGDRETLAAHDNYVPLAGIRLRRALFPYNRATEQQ